METPQLIEVVLRKDIQKVRKLLSNPKSNINERDVSNCFIHISVLKVK